MRVSSVISLPSSVSGTLKSTRMKTRLFLSSMSRMESLGMVSSSVNTSSKFTGLDSGGVR